MQLPCTAAGKFEAFSGWHLPRQAQAAGNPAPFLCDPTADDPALARRCSKLQLGRTARHFNTCIRCVLGLASRGCDRRCQ